MKSHAAITTTKHVPEDSEPAERSKTVPATPKLNVGRELADTTWRMTVPVVLFAGAGILIDKAVGSRPWVTLLAAGIGFYFAALLVKRQISNGPQPFIPIVPNASDASKAGRTSHTGQARQPGKKNNPETKL